MTDVKITANGRNTPGPSCRKEVINYSIPVNNQISQRRSKIIQDFQFRIILNRH